MFISLHGNRQANRQIDRRTCTRTEMPYSYSMYSYSWPTTYLKISLLSDSIQRNDKARPLYSLSLYFPTELSVTAKTRSRWHLSEADVHQDLY